MPRAPCCEAFSRFLSRFRFLRARPAKVVWGGASVLSLPAKSDLDLQIQAQNLRFFTYPSHSTTWSQLNDTSKYYDDGVISEKPEQYKELIDFGAADYSLLHLAVRLIDGADSQLIRSRNIYEICLVVK
ncbi:hypothetical protein NL676_038349 [Syzygium grande]|nr:hypothetical protein NL676_038349 [Syzygium grande]